MRHTGTYSRTEHSFILSLQATSSPRRLLTPSSAAPHLSRRPGRLWTKANSKSDKGASALIGRGAFGSVFRATFKGRPAAVKEVGGGQGRRNSRCGDSPDCDYRREMRGAAFLLSLSHENIVQYLQFDTSESGLLYVVMELVEGRNLAELRHQGAFSEAETRSVLGQTCRGLNYLHSHRPPIVHRDVKGSNIMLTNRDRIVKIVDLGLAILCDQRGEREWMDEDQSNRWSVAGTPRFIAPEVYERQAYSGKSDVFAFGCTVFELNCGKPPHSDKSNEMAVCYAVTRQPMPDMPAGCDPCLTFLYNWCTHKDPVERPTAQQILSHRVFDSVVRP